MSNPSDYWRYSFGNYSSLIMSYNFDDGPSDGGYKFKDNSIYHKDFYILNRHN